MKKISKTKIQKKNQQKFQKLEKNFKNKNVLK